MKVVHQKLININRLIDTTLTPENQIRFLLLLLLLLQSTQIKFKQQQQQQQNNTVQV